MELFTLFVTLGAGSAFHWAFFIRGEHHLQAGSLLYLFLLVTLSVCSTDLFLRGALPFQASPHATTLFLTFLFGLFSSIMIYRLQFHRLKNFPGPWWAKVSKLWHLYHVLDAKQYLLLEDMRRKYGDIVRTGKLTGFAP